MSDVAVVSYIDILGYEDIVARNNKNLQLITDIENIFKSSINLDCFKQGKIKDIKDKDYPTKIINAIESKFISDTIILTLRFSKIQDSIDFNKQDNIYNHFSMYFYCLSKICLHLIGYTGLILRGGISLGQHYEKSIENSLFIFSDAYIKAYNLAERDQKGKLICQVRASEELLNYLKDIEKDSDKISDKLFYSDNGINCFDLYCFCFADPQQFKNTFNDIRNGLLLNIKYLKNNNKNNELEKIKYFIYYHNKKMSEFQLDGYSIDNSVSN